MRVPPVVLVLVAIASVQIGASFAKDAFHYASPVSVAWLRLFIGAIVLTIIARPRLTGRPRSHWIVVAYGLAMGLMNGVFYLAIQRIPIGMAVTLEFLGPLVLALLGSRRVIDFVWAGLAFAGVALLGFTPGDLDLIGVGLALLAGALWAGYITLAGPTGRHWSGVTGVTVACWVGALSLTVPTVTGDTSWVTNPRVWIAGLAVGLLSSVVPYALEMVALRSIDRGVFGILMSLEPAAAALSALIILGEQLRPIEVLAMGCVIAASVGATRKPKDDAPPLLGSLES